ncbi:MAG: hypothetical protein M3280_07955 [Actinomycetota bacterium]|nr:hypothetical protein [Actinomycetota bacterium]
MDQAKVALICIGPDPQGPMRRVEWVEAIAGSGLRGDRYFQDATADSGNNDPTLEVTLVELEGIKDASASSGIDITPEDTRRNIVTSGINLDDLLGRRFRIGPVELEGLEQNPPCRHLETVSGKKLLKSLIHKGGIRARILRSGTLRRGDPLVIQERRLR